MNAMRRKKLFFDETPEFVAKVGLAAYLEMLAMKFGWRCNFSEDGVSIFDDGKPVMYAGVVKEGSMFISLKIETVRMDRDIELTRWLFELDPTMGAFSWLDPEWTLLAIDPVKPVVREALAPLYEENWARVFSKFLDGGVVGGEYAKHCFTLVDSSGEALGVLERVQDNFGEGITHRVQFIPNRHFVVEGMEQYLLGESRRVKQLFKYFNVPVPSSMTQGMRSAGDEDADDE